MIVPPGLSRPSFSAASTSRIATRSLIDPPGLNSSSFATIWGFRPAPMRDSRTSGVSPIVSRIESLISDMRVRIRAHERARGRPSRGAVALSGEVDGRRAARGGRGGLARPRRRPALGVRARGDPEVGLPLDDDPRGQLDARARAAVRRAGAARQVADARAHARGRGARRDRSGAGRLAGVGRARDQAGPRRVRRDAAVADHDTVDRGARERSSGSGSTPSASGRTCSWRPTSARTRGSGACCGSAGWRCGSTSETSAA